MATLIQKISEIKSMVPRCAVHHSVGIFTRSWKKRHAVSITVGQCSELRCTFFFLGHANDTYPLDLSIHQKHPQSRVHIQCFSVLCGNAVSDINARLTVGKTAHGSELFFSHHVLLLSESAHGKTIPSLEIMTDDVSARHEASITTLDDESRFYLESRGFDNQTATHLLIQGFLRLPTDYKLDERLKEKAEHLFDSFTQNIVYA